MKRFIPKVAVACCLALPLMYGCTSYPDKMRSLKTELTLDIDDSQCAMYRAEEAEGKNRLLALEEQGRLDQVHGRYRESAQSYRKAMEFCEFKSASPVVSVGGTLKKSLASTYGNDLAMEYPVTAFDQMMLYTLDSFNRLALGEWDHFGVDIRNLEVWRNEANEQILRDIESLNKELGKKRKEVTSGAAYTALMDKESQFTSGLKSSTDNAYSLYLIALYHEILGNNSNAIKAYKDIERIHPGIPAVQAGMAAVSSAGVNLGAGEVVVFLEEGFIPQKRNYRYQYGGLFTTVVIDLPYYSAFDCQTGDYGASAAIVENGCGVASTTMLCDFAPLAVKAHEERLRGIIARQISRTSVKAITRGIFSGMALAGLYCAANGIGDDRGYTQTALLAVGIVGSIGMGIMAAATEQADLRSWLLLPRHVQIARFPMNPGKHTLEIMTIDGRKSVDVDVKTGQKSVVYCTSLPGGMRCFSACMDKIK